MIFVVILLILRGNITSFGAFESIFSQNALKTQKIEEIIKINFIKPLLFSAKF